MSFIFFNYFRGDGEKKSKYALSESEDEEDAELRKKIELKLKEKEVDEEALIEQRRRERELILAKYKDQAPAAPAPALAQVPTPVPVKLTVPTAVRPVASKPSSPVVRGTPKTLTPISGHGSSVDSGNRSPEISAADYNDSDVLNDATHKSERIKVDWAQVSDDDSSDEEGGGAKPRKNDTPELEHTGEVEEEVEDAEALVGVLPTKERDRDPAAKDTTPAFEDDMFASAPAEDDMFAQFDSNKKLVAKMVIFSPFFLFRFVSSCPQNFFLLTFPESTANDADNPCQRQCGQLG